MSLKILTRLLTTIGGYSGGQSPYPLVTLSYAQSLDGCIAVKRGSRYLLSSRQSLVLTHFLRANSDAVLVGINTVISDDPSLTVRLVRGNNPLPIVLDSHLRFPLKSKLISNNRYPLIAATTSASRDAQSRLEDLGAKVVRTPPDDRGLVDLKDLLRQLKTAGVSNLMVEGGARVITSFLAQGLADWLVVTIAPDILTGLHAIEKDFVPAAGLKGVIDAGKVTYFQMGKDLIMAAPLSRNGQ